MTFSFAFAKEKKKEKKRKKGGKASANSSGMTEGDEICVLYLCVILGLFSR